MKRQQLQVAAYCRVSTKHEEQQQSLEAQIDYYTNYIQSHPNWVLVAVYSDTAFTGCLSDACQNIKLQRQQEGIPDSRLHISISRSGTSCLCRTA